MKLDLHLHAKERSSCSISSEQEQIEAAISFGLSGIAITDHNKLVPKKHLEELNSSYAPFKIFTGIEIHTCDTKEDILVLGIYEDILQDKKWTYEELYKFAREKHGFIAFPHPYRYSNNIGADIKRFVPDAIEIHSTNIGICDEGIIKELADGLGTKTIANSDAHNCKDVGIFGVELSSYAENNEELVEVLLTGAYKIFSDNERIRVFNEKVIERERIIRKFIQEGKSALDYKNETGNWEGQYNRVAMGKSYEI